MTTEFGDIFASIAGAEGSANSAKFDDYEADVTVEITKVAVKKSKRPNTANLPYFVLEAVVREVHDDRGQLIPNDVVGWVRFLAGKSAQFNLRDVNALCAAILNTGTASADDLRLLCADDGAGARGALVRVRMLPRESGGSTYYNPRFTHVSLPVALRDGEVPF